MPKHQLLITLIPRATPAVLQNVDPAFAAETNLARILGTSAALHAVALLFVAARLYTRAVVVKSFKLDDWLMLVAALCAFFGGMVTYIIAAQHGLGRHRAVISQADHAEYMKMTYIQAMVSSVAAFMLLKLSIGLSLLRLHRRGWYANAIRALMAYVVLYSLVGWFEFGLNCRPPSAFWDPAVRAVSECLPVDTHKAFGIFNTASNMVTDVAFASLPIYLVWTLRMRRKTRRYLIAILSLGYVSVGAGIAKVVCQQVFRGDPDQIFTNWIQFFGFIQLNIAMIAACAPPLKPLVGGFLQLSSAGTGSSSNQNGKSSGARTRSNQGGGGRIRRHTHGMPSGSAGTSKGWIKTGSCGEEQGWARPGDEIEMAGYVGSSGSSDGGGGRPGAGAQKDVGSGTTMTTCRGPCSRDGSEEIIIQGRMPEDTGIEVTQTVQVSYAG